MQRFRFGSFLVFILFSLPSFSQNYEVQYNKCSEALKEHTSIDSIYFDLLKVRDSCLIGATAPNFVAMTLDHDEMDLSKLRGKVVVLNFWFTGCQPCIKEMPYLNKLVDRYSKDDVQFISFANEDSTIVRKFLSVHVFKFKVVPSGDYVRKDIFRLFSAWPQTILIDKNGRINKLGIDLGVVDQESISHVESLIDDMLR